MNTDPDCVFCKIVAGELPATLVAEDEVAIAFMDINPLNEGHLLVVPREHHQYIATLPGSVLSHIALVAQWLAAALRASPVPADGVNLYLADGAAAGQEVPHTHMHVIPRFAGDAVRVTADRPPTPSRAQLEIIAAQIRAAATG